jgi:hypothetical protein
MLIYPGDTVAMACRYRKGLEIDEPSVFIPTLRIGALTNASESGTRFSWSLELTTLPSFAIVGSSAATWGALNRQRIRVPAS